LEKKLGRPSGLTQRQKEFAKLYIEGKNSNADCARLAGYASDSAAQHAYKLLDGKSYPEVVEFIKELRETREKKYGITLLGQLKRLAELSEGAEEAGQYSAAINAEKIRSSLGGLTIDRREANHIHQIDSLSRDEIVGRLNELRKSYPHAFVEGEYKVTEDAKNGETIMGSIEEKLPEKDAFSKA
jgi:DNA-binding CsgD family transcriptional regulator|tara:strand:- start:152 stop:706 length:555 start_codon:yes stop_codon:yes gene_type:complete